MYEWSTIAVSFRGWGLSDIKDMSPRERKNWLEVAKVVPTSKS
jgi:hypothetical protein